MLIHSSRAVEAVATEAVSVHELAHLDSAFQTSDDSARVTAFQDSTSIDTQVSALKNNQYLILLVTEDGDERNAVYDPIFGGFAADDRRSHVYGRTTNPEVSAKYGIDTYNFPAVVILQNDGSSYVVKDRLAVAKEIAYFTLPVKRQLAHIEQRFKDKDGAIRGSAILAYGLTARETSHAATLLHATRKLTKLFESTSSVERETALYACSLIYTKLEHKALLLLLNSLPVFFNEPPDVAFDAMAFCRKIAADLKFKASYEDILPVTNSLRELFLAEDPDLASGAVVTYGTLADKMPTEEITATLPILESLFTSETDFLRWGAVYVYGEFLPHLPLEERAKAEDKVLAFLNDPYAGIRNRALIILQANWEFFIPARAAELAPTLRALFSDPMQQIDVTNTAIELYVNLGALLDETERGAGREALKLLQDDEIDSTRKLAKTALEKLNSYPSQ